MVNGNTQEVVSQPEHRGPRPFAGLRVLDFTRMLAGAGTTRILGILGAEILKIEWPHPPAVDMVRLYGPPVDGIPGMDRSGFFAQINPHKKSIALDAGTDAGKAILRSLVPLSDVVIDSFRPGVLDRWGIGYEVMKGLRPDVIYVAASGFGADGPFRAYGSVGQVAQAYSGLTALSGVPEREPAGWGLSYMDHMGAAMNAAAVLMALVRRQRTGQPEFIDCAQAVQGVSLLGPALLDAALNAAAPRSRGNRDMYQNLCPNNAYRCLDDDARGRDAWVAVSVRHTADWAALCSVMGLAELRSRTELDDVAGRLAAEEEIDAAIADWTAGRRRYEAMALLQDAGVPAGAVQHIDDKVERDPQFAYRGFYQEVTEPLLGTRKYESIPFRSYSYETTITRARPRMGEHTREVLQSLLDFSDEKIDGLIRDGILIAAQPAEVVA
jgi:crotonobetainyl-CoA:carnitine CoA-transferase CaiB-like acyl-CoA transferase